MIAEEGSAPAFVEVAEELPEESKELSAGNEEVVEVVETKDEDAVAERTEEVVEVVELKGEGVAAEKTEEVVEVVEPKDEHVVAERTEEAAAPDA